MTTQGNKAVDLLFALRPLLYGLCIKYFGRPDTWTPTDRKRALVVAYTEVCNYCEGHEGSNDAALVHVDEVHKLCQCVEDARVLFSGSAKLNLLCNKIISDIKETFTGKYKCPECQGNWDVEHNRCAVNSTHCR